MKFMTRKRKALGWAGAFILSGGLLWHQVTAGWLYFSPEGAVRRQAELNGAGRVKIIREISEPLLTEGNRLYLSGSNDHLMLSVAEETMGMWQPGAAAAADRGEGSVSGGCLMTEDDGRHEGGHFHFFGIIWERDIQEIELIGGDGVPLVQVKERDCFYWEGKKYFVVGFYQQSYDFSDYQIRTDTGEMWPITT